jgi:hypothetical protein
MEIRGAIEEEPMPGLIRCIAWFPNGSKKIRMFPDDRWGVQDAVSWEWKMINGDATKIEYFRADGIHGFLYKKGTFYSSKWVPFDLKKEEKDDSGPTE